MPVARRGFLMSVAAVPLAPAALGAQGVPPPAGPPGETDEVAGALGEAVKQEFGAHLDAAEIQAVKKELAKALERAQRLRTAVRLTNADEPVTRFEARPPKSGGVR